MAPQRYTRRTWHITFVRCTYGPPAKMFTVPQPLERRFAWQGAVVFLGLVAAIADGVSLAVSAPNAPRGPEMSLAVQV